MRKNERQCIGERLLSIILIFILISMAVPTVRASGGLCFELRPADDYETICSGDTYEFDLTVRDIVPAGGLIGIDSAALTFDPAVFRLDSVEAAAVDGWQMDYSAKKTGEIVFNPSEIYADGRHAVTEDGVIAFHIVLKSLSIKTTETTIAVVRGSGTSIKFDRIDATSFPSLTYDCTLSHMISGDMNLDGQFDRNDAIYLLYATVFGDAYPLPETGDVNSDSVLDRNDAVYLLYASIFGTEKYPLPDIGTVSGG